jgi:hypothetical protein
VVHAQMEKQLVSAATSAWADNVPGPLVCLHRESAAVASAEQSPPLGAEEQVTLLSSAARL